MTNPFSGNDHESAENVVVAQPDATAKETPWHILASSSVADERTRVLKHGDTFAVFDHYGDVMPGGLGEQGLYHEGTRYVSCLILEMEGNRPFFLGSTVRDENDQLIVNLTNPDLLRAGELRHVLGALHLESRTFLWRGACYRQVRVKNHGIVPLDTFLLFHFEADFADIFEVRGMKRKVRGEDLTTEVTGNGVVRGYRGLDGCERRTHVRFEPRPARLNESAARFNLVLQPLEEFTIDVTIACQRGASTVSAPTFEVARRDATTDLELDRSWACHLNTTNGQFNNWINRAVSDLHMLTTQLPTGPYPYAGVPWFNTPFGRDGLITALECLWLRPALSKGVLTYLAQTQATEVIVDEDAEPGKILHETRNGEMAILKEMPFGRYYGSVDSTPLFVLLAAAYYRRTADREMIESLWPHIKAGLDWIQKHGDRDGDGFVEYRRRSVNGLIHQGWKDSDDAVFHADGSLAKGAIALCEVQAYVYAAWKAGACLAEALGHNELAGDLAQKSEALQRRFEAAFWCEELKTYALALDGEKRPCRVRTSNAGQCLFTGIASPEHARSIAKNILDPESFSGWGIRTLSETEVRYNPMSYHNGTIWPHDNALIALGLSRYGLSEYALPILSGMFEAGLHFELNRMPELFCGFPQAPGEGPILYPVACAPQAWSAASVFLLIQACLGLEVDGLERTVVFSSPQLPEYINELRIHNLEVGGATVDLMLVRNKYDVGVNVLRREGDLRVLLVK